MVLGENPHTPCPERGEESYWPHLNESTGREPTQFVAQQFSGRGLRQFVRKFDMSWVLVWRDSMFDELLQFAREIRSSCDAFPNHDEGFGSVEFRIFSISDHRRLQDAFVLNQGAFDLKWRDPLTRNPEHIVGTARIPVVPILIHPIFIAGGEPVPKHALSR